jgi:glycosyltransferase involved in cell wall biosynthesis
MKILFATEYYHPFVPGGTPWSLRLLAGELSRRGADVAIVTPNYGAPAREDVDGVPVFRFPFWRKLAPGPSLAPVRDHVNPLFHLLFARALIGVARGFGADILHAQEKHALVGTFLAGRWLRRPVLLSLRDFGLICPIATCLLAHAHVPGDCGSVKLQRECAGFFLDHYVGGGAWRRLRVRASLALLYLDARLKGALVKRVGGVVGVSQSIVDIYAGADRIPAARSGVVYNLTPPPGPPPTDRRRRLVELGLRDGPVVLYVGKTSLGKGFPVFVEAAGALATRWPAVSFVAVGSAERGAAERAEPVQMLGSRPHADVEALYAVADIVVHPAVWPEPFSRVPLEAAAFSRPVIGTRIGGTPEAVEDKVTGLLVERNDPRALAEAIEQLLSDETLRAELGRRAALHVARAFGPDRVVKQLLAAYQKVGA